METSTLIARLLDVMEHDIAPKTRAGVALGNKVFGAAILHKSDLSLVIAETNNERENPLWHGEVHAIKRFYELPAEQRRWYLDGGVKARDVLRKLDNPHHHREAFKNLARHPRLVPIVEQIIGKGVAVYFSQIFFKAPIMILSSRTLISSSVQKKELKSCTHSK